MATSWSSEPVTQTKTGGQQLVVYHSLRKTEIANVNACNANSTKILSRTQPPDCHIHPSLLVLLPRPLLSQLSGQTVPGTSSMAQPLLLLNKGVKTIIIKAALSSLSWPSDCCFATPSKTSEKSNTGQLWDQWVLGQGSGKGKQNTQCPSHRRDIPSHLSGGDLQGPSSIWDLWIVTKWSTALLFPSPTTSSLKAHRPTVWKYNWICT